MTVIRLRRNISLGCSPEPLRGIMGLKPRLAQLAKINLSEGTPILIAHDNLRFCYSTVEDR